MSVTLNELLMLAGRLDDTAGFDTPRERFRRFLLEHVSDAHVARSLIEQCQHAPGDQHRRVLQDLVVVLGRCLGFETRFGSYLPAAGSVKPDGYWRSRRLDLVLEIRTDQTQTTDLDGLSRTVETVATTAHSGRAGRVLGLCVLTPLYAGRARLPELEVPDDRDSRVRTITLGSLLFVADMMSARRLSHDDLARVVESGLQLDFLVDLLERTASAAGTPDSSSSSSTLSERQAGTSFWLATIGTDRGTTPEQLVEVVVGKRHVLGVTEGRAPRGIPQAGDGVCFHIPGKGIVGHGRVRSTAEGGDGIRGADRFSHLLQLEDVVLHMHAPLPLEEEMQLRVQAARAGRERAAHSVTRISRLEFDHLTTVRDTEDRRLGDSTKAAAPDRPAESGEPVSVGGLRSPE